MSKRKRLKPTPTVVRQLYITSGNACAFPRCASRLVDQRGIFVGQIAHIVGASEDGPRNDPDFTDEDARRLSNLMLFCPTHHVKVDRDEVTWSSPVLRQMKASHEALFTNFISQMIDGAANIRDRSNDVPGTPATTLKSWMWDWEGGPGQLSAEELADTLRHFDAMFEQLGQLSKEARDFLVVIIRESFERDPTASGHAPAIELDILARKTRLDDRDVGQLLNELSIKKVASVEFEPDGLQYPYVELRMPSDIDAAFWIWTADYLKATGCDFTEFFADLRFDLLDASANSDPALEGA